MCRRLFLQILILLLHYSSLCLRYRGIRDQRIDVATSAATSSPSPASEITGREKAKERENGVPLPLRCVLVAVPVPDLLLLRYEYLHALVTRNLVVVVFWEPAPQVCEKSCEESRGHLQTCSHPLFSLLLFLHPYARRTLTLASFSQEQVLLPQLP